MYKIAVIGDRDSVLGFKALGVSTHFAYDAERAETLIKRMAREKYAVIFITEELAEKTQEIIDRYKSRTIPAIIPIPSNQGSTGIGMKMLNANVEKAVGVNILLNDDEGSS
ncbi:MAG: V-type ATP synthase subunit F [Eubacteriales bacterium]